MQQVPQNPISTKENHISRTINPNPAQYKQVLTYQKDWASSEIPNIHKLQPNLKSQNPQKDAS